MRGVLRWSILAALTASSACVGSGRDQLLVIVQVDKYGYIDHTGRVIIRPQFIYAEDFWRGLGTVYVCGHYVSIDASGTIFPLRVAVHGQLKGRCEKQKCGFVDEEGRFQINPSFDDTLPFRDGLAAVKIGEKWGFIDTSGRLAIQPQFTDAYYFSEGVGTARLDSRDVLIDRSGQVLASGFKFTDIISHGRVPATRDDKSGYLDLQGHIAIPFVYDSVTAFSDGLAAVKKTDKWGYLDPSGRLVIPFTFDEAGLFGSGLAPVVLGTRTGFINKSGNFSFDLPFEHAAGFLTGDEEYNMFIADSDVSGFWTAEGKFGYVSTAGRVIWGPTDGSPEHPPLQGWSDADNAASCEGISESMRVAVARLFPG